MIKDSRENILKRLEKAISEKSEVPYPEISDADALFHPEDSDLKELFRKQFLALGGIFYSCKTGEEIVAAISKHCENINQELIFCADEALVHLLSNAGFAQKLNSNLKIPEASLCISSCISLIARTGSILFSSVQAEGRSHAIAPDLQIVIAYEKQLLYNVGQALTEHCSRFSKLPSMINLTSGASRTADIEKTMVMGAHGPKELIVVLVEE